MKIFITTAFLLASTALSVDGGFLLGLQPLSKISPAATEPLQKLVESVRDNQGSKLPSLDVPALLGDSPMLVSYAREMALFHTESLKNGHIVANIKNMDLGAFQIESLTKKLESTDSQSWGDLFGLDALSLAFSTFENHISASWANFLAGLVAVNLSLEQASQLDADLSGPFLNIKETVPWYFAASLLVLGVTGVAREVVRQPKVQMVPLSAVELVPDPSVETASVSAIKSQMEAMRNTTNKVKQQLSKLQVEKEAVDCQLASLKSELRDLNNKLELSRATENDLRKSLAITQEDMVRETGELQAKLQQCAFVETDLRAQLAISESKLSKERVKWTEVRQKALTKIATAHAQVLKLQEEKVEMKAELVSLRDNVASMKDLLANIHVHRSVVGSGKEEEEAGTESVVEEGRVLVMAGSLPEDQPGLHARSHVQKTRGTDLKSEQSTPVVESDEMLESLSGDDAHFSDFSSLKTSAEKENLDSPETTGRMMDIEKKKNEDWTSLSISALKRKTVKALVAYLEDKGMITIDSSGKTLPKNRLVDLVLNQ